MTSGSTPTETVTPTDLMLYADEAANYEDRFLRRASEWPSEYISLVQKAAKRRFRNDFAARGRLNSLMNCLRRVPDLADQRKIISHDRDDAQAITAENRKADQILANKHPKGDLIGSEPITGFKSQGKKYHWATRRKRR